MTPEKLWRIFQEECKKEYILSLNFTYDNPPEDLSFWESVLNKIKEESAV